MLRLHTIRLCVLSNPAFQSFAGVYYLEVFMDQKFLHRTFRLSALTLAIVALSACGGGGSSGGSGGGSGGNGGGTPAPPADDAESDLPTDAPLPAVDENGFPTLEGAISSYTPDKRTVETTDASKKCDASATYIVSDRFLQVGFRRGNKLSDDDQMRLAKIAGLALDTTLTNYGFAGSEAELAVSKSFPYYVCVKPASGSVKLLTDRISAELVPYDKDEVFYRQAKDQFANAFVERLRSTEDNYDEVQFWFDEGLSNFAGDNQLIGSPTTWSANVGSGGPLPPPMSVKRLPNLEAGSPSVTGSNYYKLYPYYATTIAFFLDEDGLKLDKLDLAEWLKRGVADDNFEAAFNALKLGEGAPGGPVNFSQLETQHVALVKTWLETVGSTTELTALTTADPALDPATVETVTIQRKPDWQFASIVGYVLPASATATSVSFESLTYKLVDGYYPLYIRTTGKCYGGLEVEVLNGKAANTLSAATAQVIDCGTIPL